MQQVNMHILLTQDPIMRGSKKTNAIHFLFILENQEGRTMKER